MSKFLISIHFSAVFFTVTILTACSNSVAPIPYNDAGNLNTDAGQIRLGELGQECDQGLCNGDNLQCYQKQGSAEHELYCYLKCDLNTAESNCALNQQCTGIGQGSALCF